MPEPLPAVRSLGTSSVAVTALEIRARPMVVQRLSHTNIWDPLGYLHMEFPPNQSPDEHLWSLSAITLEDPSGNKTTRTGSWWPANESAQSNKSRIIVPGMRIPWLSEPVFKVTAQWATSDTNAGAELLTVDLHQGLKVLEPTGIITRGYHANAGTFEITDSMNVGDQKTISLMVTPSAAPTHRLVLFDAIDGQGRRWTANFRKQISITNAGNLLTTTMSTNLQIRILAERLTNSTYYVHPDRRSTAIPRRTSTNSF